MAKIIDVRDAPNAASVLARVLIEFSIDNYIKNNNNLKPKDSLNKGIKSVAAHMLTNGKIEKSYHDEIVRIANHDNLLSITSLQRLVHSPDFSPDTRLICTLWDNIDKLITRCWK